MHKAAHSIMRDHSLGVSSRPKLRVPEAARYLGVSVSYLNKTRIYGNGPPFMKLPGGTILYDPADVDRWLAAYRCCSTSEHE